MEVKIYKIKPGVLFVRAGSNSILQPVHTVSRVDRESPCLLNYVITDFEVIIEKRQLLPGIVNHISCFRRNGIMAFPRNSFLIEGASHYPHYIWEKYRFIYIIYFWRF